MAYNPIVIGGGTEATAQRVTIASDSTGVLSVDDNGGSLTVDGTIAVTQSGTWDEVGINDSGNSITIDYNGSAISTSNAVPIQPPASGFLAVQETGSSLTALQLIDDGVYTDDTSTHSTGSSKGYGIMAAATPTDGSVNANDIGMLAMTTDRKLHVSVQDSLPAGTNAIGKLAANSGVDIGDVDVTSAVITGGSVAHDSADSGNPIKIGGRAVNAEIAAVANNDRSDFVTDLTGKQIILPYSNPENMLVGTITTAMTGTTSTAVSGMGAPGAGLRNYITSVIISNAHATVGTDVILQDGSGGTTIGTFPAAATYGGVAIALPTPIRQPTTNTALYAANVTTGASVKVTCYGYKGA